MGTISGMTTEKGYITMEEIMEQIEKEFGDVKPFSVFDAPVNEQLDTLVVGLEAFIKNHKRGNHTRAHLLSLSDLMLNILKSEDFT